ncbi:MAG: hypothetical protein MUE63_00265 [Xanthomonadales bacterium]|jgi:hypothetical protein|nr:hypothetical protein [Xanthomonadales bacterium]
MSKRTSQLAAASSLSGAEIVAVSKLSSTVTITATTISAQGSDNSFNDSANGFVAAGFTSGKAVKISGFTGSGANNIISGVITAVTAGKITIGGTDGDVIVDDAAGESVTITQWDSKRIDAQSLANLSSSGMYNVRTYGATGDGTTDDTTAVQAAIDAAAAAGGGVVFFPKGVYKIGGSLQDTSRSNAQLLLPRINWSAEQISIELRGEVAPPAGFSVIGSMTLPDNHTIIKGTLNTSGGTAPCLIGAWGPSGSTGDFSNVHVAIRNMTIRMPSNPVLTAVDLEHVICCEIDNVIFDTGSYDIDGLSEMTTSTSYGLKLPALNNDAHTVLGIVNVLGFYKGIKVGEHTHGHNVNVWGCRQALEFVAGSHPSQFGRLGVYHCQRGLVGTGGLHFVNIEQFNIEHDSAGTWVTTYDIDDSSNYLKGWVKWHVVLAGTGHDDTFTVNGAQWIRRERFGKWCVYWLTDAATIDVPAGISDSFRVTLAGNRTLANPTGLYDGQVINFRIIQDATGSRTLAYGSKYKFSGGTPVLSTAANSKDFLSCQYDATDDTLFCSLLKGMA